MEDPQSPEHIRMKPVQRKCLSMLPCSPSEASHTPQTTEPHQTAATTCSHASSCLGTAILGARKPFPAKPVHSSHPEHPPCLWVCNHSTPRPNPKCHLPATSMTAPSCCPTPCRRLVGGRPRAGVGPCAGATSSAQPSLRCCMSFSASTTSRVRCLLKVGRTCSTLEGVSHARSSCI